MGFSIRRRLLAGSAMLALLPALPAAATPQSVDLFFSGEIVGNVDNPDYTVESYANFSWNDTCVGAGPSSFCTLTITLQALPSADGAIPSQGEVLTALVFDVIGTADFRDGPPANTPWPGGSATASALEGADAGSFEYGLDVSGHWALNPAIVAQGGGGTLALSSVGDLYDGAQTVGSMQLLDTGLISTLEASSPNGVGFGIIDANSVSGGMGWGMGNQVYIQDEVVVVLNYEGTLTDIDTEKVEPLYGTMGLTIPEPGTFALLASGLLGLALTRPRRCR